MRSVMLSNAGSFPQAADYVEVLLRDLGGLTNAALVTLPDFTAKTPDTLESRVAGLLSRYVAGTPLVVTENLVPTAPTNSALKSSTSPQSDLGTLVGVYAYRSGLSVAIVLNNRAAVPVIMDVELPAALSNGRLDRYDSEGHLADSATVRGNRVRVSTLPGWVYVVSGETAAP
jgi:hypothetical protein